MDTLLVCSNSTRNYLGDYKNVKVVSSAPQLDILNEVDSADNVVAIGGGAVIDTAKIISKNPIVCYPTTAAGSSATSWSVYWDGNKKLSIKRLMPDKVIFKKLHVNKLPDSVIMSTTCDVLSHCIDSLISVKATSKSKKYCYDAIKFIENKKHNIDLIKAGHIAGKAIEITGTNLLHSLSYPLTGYYGISHGIALGYFLPKISKFLGFNIDSIIKDYNICLEDIDLKFVIKEAFKYDKINECKIDINEKIIGALYD